MKLRLVLSFLLILPLFLYSDMKEDLLKGAFVEGITVDLREPVYCEGVLKTDKGGVINGPNLRIQARKIVYTRMMNEDQPIYTIEAEEDLMLEFGDYVFVGDRLEYDFQTGTGIIYCARSGLAPWYVGGEVIYLLEDGSYRIENGFITTSDNLEPDWHISAEEATLQEERYLRARNVKFRLFKTTLFWLPSLSLDLQSISEIPVRFTFGWGGRQGPRVGMSYEVFSWNGWKTFVRLDYRLNRGLGAGIITSYHSPDNRESFETINYLARDSSIFHPHEKYRYRFQGAYHNQLFDDQLTIDFTYDKLSDKYMAIDYADQSLDIETAGRTQLDVRRQADAWISNLMTRVRVNSFETVKQELPSLLTTWRPFEIGATGIIADHKLEMSYLNFAYANNVVDVHDYSAIRLFHQQQLYRPFACGPLNITPEAGSTLIYYGNGPHHDDDWVVLGLFGCNINAPFYRYFGVSKHVVVPYANYQYFTFPTTSPDDHYIFDIDDGWYRLDMLRFGTTHNLYYKDDTGCVRRYFFTDLYANAFFDTETIPQAIPKIYLRSIYSPCLTLRHTIETAWDFSENEMDHFNIRTQWTVNPDIAISGEFRYRDAFAWRKVDRDNFILDSFRSIEELLRSQVSDRRCTFLIHFFYRLHPNWALEYEARHGWHQRDHTRYNEFEIDLHGNITSSMRAKLSFQHTESENRLAVYFSVWPQGPEGWHDTDGVTCTDY